MDDIQSYNDGFLFLAMKLPICSDQEVYDDIDIGICLPHDRPLPMNISADNQEEYRSIVIPHCSSDIVNMLLYQESLSSDNNELNAPSPEIQNIIDTRKELFSLNNALDAASVAVGVAYYGTVIWMCPFPALALVGFKALEYSGLLDNYCGKDQEFYGYTACDVVKTSIEGYLIYATGAQIAKIFGSASASRVVTVGAKIMSKTLLSPKQLNQETIKTPSLSTYAPIAVSEVSYEFLKQSISSVIPGGRVVQVILFKGAAHFVNKVTKEAIKESPDFGGIRKDTLFGSFKTSTCKLLLDNDNDLIYFQLDPYCRRIAEFAINTMYVLYTEDHRVGDSKKPSTEIII